MNLELNSIMKYDKLKKVMNIINEYMESKNYLQAYYKVAAMLEFINSNLLMKHFKIKLEDTSIDNIIELYAKKDEELSRQMISVNSEYNNIDDSTLKESDVEYLLLKVNDILEYITDKYGNIF